MGATAPTAPGYTTWDRPTIPTSWKFTRKLNNNYYKNDNNNNNDNENNYANKNYINNNH